MSIALNEQIKQQIHSAGAAGMGAVAANQKSTSVRQGNGGTTYLRAGGAAIRALSLWGLGSPVADPLRGAKPAIAVTIDLARSWPPRRIPSKLLWTPMNLLGTAAPVTDIANGVGAEPVEAKPAIGVIRFEGLSFQRMKSVSDGETCAAPVLQSALRAFR